MGYFGVMLHDAEDSTKSCGNGQKISLEMLRISAPWSYKGVWGDSVFELFMHQGKAPRVWTHKKPFLIKPPGAFLPLASKDLQAGIWCEIPKKWWTSFGGKKGKTFALLKSQVVGCKTCLRMPKQLTPFRPTLRCVPPDRCAIWLILVG